MDVCGGARSHRRGPVHPRIAGGSLPGFSTQIAHIIQRKRLYYSRLGHSLDIATIHKNCTLVDKIRNELLWNTL